MEFVRDFPEAQSPDGCANRVSEGVIPNQHGTWYFGRGGWCPGLDVAPWVVDVTSQARPGHRRPSVRHHLQRRPPRLRGDGQHRDELLPRRVALTAPRLAPSRPHCPALRSRNASSARSASRP
ncbi:MAG: peptide-N-glycosidase F-related protein [Polyangiales bacterium]